MRSRWLAGSLGVAQTSLADARGCSWDRRGLRCDLAAGACFFLISYMGFQTCFYYRENRIYSLRCHQPWLAWKSLVKMEAFMGKSSQSGKTGDLAGFFDKETFCCLHRAMWRMKTSGFLRSWSSNKNDLFPTLRQTDSSSKRCNLPKQTGKNNDTPLNSWVTTKHATKPGDFNKNQRCQLGCAMKIWDLPQ